MPGIRNYPQDYIDAVRAKVKSDAAEFRKMAETGCAHETFEPAYFNNLVIVLDHCFVNRLHSVEGKDGNPLNEVRLIGDSIVASGGKLSIDKSIKYDPDKSILNLRIGDEIRMNEASFLLLAEAFFAELERRFAGTPEKA